MKKLSSPQAQLIDHLLDERNSVKLNKNHSMLCPLFKDGLLSAYCHRSTIQSLDRKGMIVQINADTYVLSPNWKEAQP
jgi:hypothetical protein